MKAARPPGAGSGVSSGATSSWTEPGLAQMGFVTFGWERERTMVEGTSRSCSFERGADGAMNTPPRHSPPRLNHSACNNRPKARFKEQLLQDLPSSAVAGMDCAVAAGDAHTDACSSPGTRGTEHGTADARENGAAWPVRSALVPARYVHAAGHSKENRNIECGQSDPATRASGTGAGTP
jgi:hypothetical protein